MITLTRWIIAFMINYLIVIILIEIFDPTDLIGYILLQLIDVLILIIIRLWRFIYWNIKSDEDLGIKSGIELF